jgi:hypothetical protein
MKPLAFALLIAVGCCIVTLADDAASLSLATIDYQGFLAHVMNSPFQNGTTQLRMHSLINLAALKS